MSIEIFKPPKTQLKKKTRLQLLTLDSGDIALGCVDENGALLESGVICCITKDGLELEPFFNYTKHIDLPTCDSYIKTIKRG